MTTTSPRNASQQLSLTERGAAWLEQFDLSDREHALSLLEALTLVSHSEFERAMTALIIQHAESVQGSVALYAIREFSPLKPFFQDDGTPINAVAKGSDLGSEARIAALIRNLSRTNPTKYLNHPTIAEMRRSKCRAIYLVDDFIGSGKRCASFLQSFWLNSSIRSWRSLGLISIAILTYTATNVGRRLIARTVSKPQILLERHCPTFSELPWLVKTIRESIKLLKLYGAKTSRRKMALGFGNNAAALVFEHGCPNNCPAIFWAPKTSKQPWEPLFPERSVLPPEASAFPPEIARKDPVIVMIQAGERRLALSGALSGRGPIGPTMLLIMGLASKGIRKRAALAHATGASATVCDQILDQCVRWGLLTPTLHLTKTGNAELQYARGTSSDPKRLPPLGIEDYYPRSLRGSANG